MISCSFSRWKVSSLSAFYLIQNSDAVASYDATAITFIASKCDDISCSEVIRSLQLEDDPELEEIEDRIEQYTDDTKEWKQKKSAVDKKIKGKYLNPWD